MADYKQTTVTGHRWNRFSRVIIDNPRNGAPSVMCVEQEVIILGEGDVIRDMSNLNFPFDPATSFQVINPDTNEPSGVIATGAEVYALVYSYVMAEAVKRDAALHVEPVKGEVNEQPTGNLQ